MTPDELIKWHEVCADNASSRGAHTIASKHAKTVHFMRAALEPIAPPDVAQAARVAELIEAASELADRCETTSAQGHIGKWHEVVTLRAALRAIADGGAE